MPATPPLRTSPAIGWVLIVSGAALLLAAVALSWLLYVYRPAPSRPLPGWVPFLLADIGLLGAFGLANGVQARRTGTQNPILRGLTLAGGAAFVGICLASLR